ncbi:MAG: hypothetical protein ACYC5V_15515 [Gemmatimonadaceae bacterium]
MVRFQEQQNRRTGLRLVAAFDADTPDTPDGKEVIEISVCYRAGGTNGWSGAAEPRGVYLHINPVRISVAGTSGLERRMTELGGAVRTSGMRAFVAPLPRRSDARLRRVAAALEGEVEMLARLWVRDTPAGVERLGELARYASQTLAVA